MQERPYLSIGEVLALLLEEFPDVTISKIRFLESQGLIDPERTASGYRKFYDNDVDLLRVILREQRENFLQLRVIGEANEAFRANNARRQAICKGFETISGKNLVGSECERFEFILMPVCCRRGR